jgi:hypothetical protein
MLLLSEHAIHLNTIKAPMAFSHIVLSEAAQILIPTCVHYSMQACHVNLTDPIAKLIVLLLCAVYGACQATGGLHISAGFRHAHSLALPAVRVPAGKGQGCLREHVSPAFITCQKSSTSKKCCLSMHSHKIASPVRSEIW